jgi:hypothetical protein
MQVIDKPQHRYSQISAISEGDGDQILNAIEVSPHARL